MIGITILYYPPKADQPKTDETLDCSIAPTFRSE